MCTRIDVWFLERLAVFAPVPRNTILGNAFERGSLRLGCSVATSALQRKCIRMNGSGFSPAGTITYLSIGNMFASNSLNFDCISNGVRRFENRLLPFNFKWRVAFVRSTNFSYSGNLMMCCGEKWTIKSNRWWSATFANCSYTKSNLTTKSMEGTSRTETKRKMHRHYVSEIMILHAKSHPKIEMISTLWNRSKLFVRLQFRLDHFQIATTT